MGGECDGTGYGPALGQRHVERVEALALVESVDGVAVAAARSADELDGARRVAADGPAFLRWRARGGVAVGRRVEALLELDERVDVVLGERVLERVDGKRREQRSVVLDHLRAALREAGVAIRECFDVVGRALLVVVVRVAFCDERVGAALEGKSDLIVGAGEAAGLDDHLERLGRAVSGHDERVAAAAAERRRWHVFRQARRRHLLVHGGAEIQRFLEGRGRRGRDGDARDVEARRAGAGLLTVHDADDGQRQPRRPARLAGEFGDVRVRRDVRVGGARDAARGGRSRDGIRREATVLERLGQYRVDGGLVDDVAAAQDLGERGARGIARLQQPLAPVAVGVVVVGPRARHADKRAPLRFDFDLERRSAGTSKDLARRDGRDRVRAVASLQQRLAELNVRVPGARLDDGIHGVVERRLEAVLLQVRLDHHALGFEVLVAHDTAAF